MQAMARDDTATMARQVVLGDLHHDTEMPAGEAGFGAETRVRRPRPANLAAGRRINPRHGDDHLVLRKRSAHPTPQ